MNLSYVLTIIIFILIVYFINVYKDEIEKKMEIKLYIFDVISIVFILLFVYYGYKRGTKYGFLLSAFIWAFFVCTTPIPEAGLLLSFPLKHFFDVPMDISQIFISIFALVLLYLFYNNSFTLLKSITIGRIFNKIIHFNLYSVFAACIIASIAGAFLIDQGIDKFFLIKDNLDINKIIISTLVMIILNIYYFYILHKKNIWIKH